MFIKIFMIIFTCELIAIIIYILAKLISEIYIYKKVNKNFGKLMKASQDGIGVIKAEEQ